MTDSNLVRVMQAQSRRRVGLVRYDTLAQGADAVRRRLEALQADGTTIAIADAVNDGDLRTLGAACVDLPLVTAGSGLALGLPALYAQRGWARLDREAGRLEGMTGPGAVLAGSCSMATNAQVRDWQGRGWPAHAIDPRRIARGEPVVEEALAWHADVADRGPALLYATMPPDELKAIQDELGAARAGTSVEEALARIAAGLVDAGVQRLVVAGGETSGAVVQALGVRALRIGEPICPGVPWTRAEGRPLWLALKSGNFGSPAFFAEALGLDGSAA